MKDVDVESTFENGYIILWRTSADNVLGITVDQDKLGVTVHVDSRRHGIPELADWMRGQAGNVTHLVSQTPDTPWYTTNT